MNRQGEMMGEVQISGAPMKILTAWMAVLVGI
jgi:hypothetical protein